MNKGTDPEETAKDNMDDLARELGYDLKKLDKQKEKRSLIIKRFKEKMKDSNEEWHLVLEDIIHNVLG